jgi:hypothetical protein
LYTTSQLSIPDKAEERDQMPLLSGRYDPTTGTTYRFFSPAQGSDADGPYSTLLRDTWTLGKRLPLLLVVLCPFFTARPEFELYLLNSSLIWLSLWSIVLSPLLILVFAVIGLVSSIIAAFIWVQYILIWKKLHGPQLQVYPHDLPPDFYANGDLSKERWVFISGIMTTNVTLHQNLVMLNHIFRRPVLGINNHTYGFWQDIFECVIQRCLELRTRGTRIAYPIIRNFLLDQTVSRVVVIAHSQGSIITSQILDILYTELNDPNLQKLEIYTFGNAALHFNNPRNVVRHIEHYCNEHDMVCSWGAISSTGTPGHLFHGKVFVMQRRSGHLLNQHYLSRMFPDLADMADFLDQKAQLTSNNRYLIPGDRNPLALTRNVSRLHRYTGGRVPLDKPI